MILLADLLDLVWLYVNQSLKHIMVKLVFMMLNRMDVILDLHYL